jgi:hypothetical protein
VDLSQWQAIRSVAANGMGPVNGGPRKMGAPAIGQTRLATWRRGNCSTEDGAVTGTRSRGVKAGSFSSGSGGGRSPPRLERFVSEDSERGAGCEMALDIKSVMDGGVSGEEALG